jgi:hypothetical protein
MQSTSPALPPAHASASLGPQSAEACVQQLEGKVGAAQQQLREMEAATEVRASDLRAAEKARVAGEASRALLSSRMAAARRQQAAAQVGRGERAGHVQLALPRGPGPLLASK